MWKEDVRTPTLLLHLNPFWSKIDTKSIQMFIKKTINKNMEFDAKGIPKMEPKLVTDKNRENHKKECFSEW